MSTTTTLSTAQRTRSEAAYADACRVMPGGVNSPVRAFRAVGGHPVFFEKAQGAYLWDVDGNRYIDFIGSWGPAILGHAHPAVIERITAVAAHGTTFGAPTVLETELARRVIAMVPSVEKVRFVSSGTEAVMSVIRLARAATGRDRILKFSGCYHGHVDPLLVKAGSGVATLGMPDSAGVPAPVAAQTLIAHFNDLDTVRALMQAHGDEVAGILVEPVAGNMGCVAPAPGFLEGLRLLADQYDTLLIFDEVMTGFRVALGGAQERFGVTPDLTAMGKIIGGGLPAAAYGGRHDLMAMVAPEGPMYQAGTLSGNPLAMAAGLETLNRLDTSVYSRLEAVGQSVAEGLLAACGRAGVPAQVNQVGSMVTLFFTETPVVDYDSALTADRERFARWFRGLLDRGVYWPPSQFESAFLSTALTDADVSAFLAAAEASLLAC